MLFIKCCHKTVFALVSHVQKFDDIYATILTDKKTKFPSLRCHFEEASIRQVLNLNYRSKEKTQEGQTNWRIVKSLVTFRKETTRANSSLFKTYERVYHPQLCWLHTLLRTGSKTWFCATRTLVYYCFKRSYSQLTLICKLLAAGGDSNVISGSISNYMPRFVLLSVREILSAGEGRGWG